jgi:signal transduction histidine kinase
MIAADARDEALVKHANIIAEQAQRMTGILGELLDFSRRRGAQPEEARIRDVVGQAVTLIEPIAEAGGVRLVVDEVDDLGATLDVGKTLQVLTNLMMNAVQAMPAGGTLTLGARAADVAEPKDDHAEPGPYVVLEVADEGGGIAEDDLEQIFRPFFTTKRQSRGTGLGLYVCQGIVREQLGWIEVESELGRGSRFSVFLPLRDTEGRR